MWHTNARGRRLPRAATPPVPGAHSAFSRGGERSGSIPFPRAATKWTRPQLSVDNSDPRFRSAVRAPTGEEPATRTPNPRPPRRSPVVRSFLSVLAEVIRLPRTRSAFLPDVDTGNVDNTVNECVSPFSRCLFAYFYCTRMRCRRARHSHLEILSLISRGLKSKCP